MTTLTAVSRTSWCPSLRTRALTTASTKNDPNITPPANTVAMCSSRTIAASSPVRSVGAEHVVPEGGEEAEVPLRILVVVAEVRADDRRQPRPPHHQRRPVGREV